MAESRCHDPRGVYFTVLSHPRHIRCVCIPFMLNHHQTLIALCCCVVTLTLFSSCSGGAQPGGPVTLKGAGATAPYPLYSKWVEAFRKEHPEVDLDYGATGSGAGLEKFKAQTIDFVGSDFPLTDEEMATLPVKPLHFPTLVGAIVLVYNVTNGGTLRFSGDLLAGIFSGRIGNWNDPALAKINPIWKPLPPPASTAEFWRTSKRRRRAKSRRANPLPDLRP